jgi:hypothetical protein
VSKKTNTLLFILGATVFNVLITIISFVILLVLYVRVLMPLLPESSQGWGLPIIFVGALALAVVSYRIAIKQLLKRINVDKYFDPLFGPRRPSRPRD